MGDGREEQIESLMAEGLDHYGMDRLEQAARCWRQVLELDSGHAEAREYLVAAGFEEASEASAPESGSDDKSLVWEALDLMRGGQGEEAIQLLETLCTGGRASLEVLGYLELLRSRLFQETLATLGQGRGVPRMAMAPDQVMKFNLPANAGFLLSMVDGMTSVSDILAVSGMDPFEVLMTIHKLASVGIVEVES